MRAAQRGLLEFRPAQRAPWGAPVELRDAQITFRDAGGSSN
jgi:hypothetical protein